MNIETIKSELKSFLKSYDPNMQTYFDQDIEDEDFADSMDWSGGNFDDAMQHGYDAGYNDAQKNIVERLKKIGIELS